MTYTVTHFDNYHRTACGIWVRKQDRSTNPLVVDCSRCMRTNVYKEAKVEALKRREKTRAIFAKYMLDPEKPVCEMTPEEIKQFKQSMRVSLSSMRDDIRAELEEINKDKRS